MRDLREECIDRLSEKRHWTLGPPEFVYETEDPSALGPGDKPAETVGGLIQLYTALPPWCLPITVDRRHFEEVSDLVELLASVSLHEQIDFDLDLDGELVGTIVKGELDEMLKVGLLGEWERHLKNRERRNA